MKKEKFCASCVAVPMAFAGSGLAMYGTSNNDEDKKTKGSNKQYKKILLYSGLLSIFIGVVVYYKYSCKNGKYCKY